MNRVFETLKFRAAKLLSDKQEVRHMLHRANDKVDQLSQKDDKLGKLLRQVKLFRRMVRAYINGYYREVPVKSVVLIVAGLLYFIMPLDLIPDMLPITGFVDDMSVLLWVANSVRDDLEAFREWELQQEQL